VWQTDRQTDGQTNFSSLYRVCITCSAVKNTHTDTHTHTYKYTNICVQIQIICTYIGTHFCNISPFPLFFLPLPFSPSSSFSCPSFFCHLPFPYYFPKMQQGVWESAACKLPHGAIQWPNLFGVGRRGARRSRRPALLISYILTARKYLSCDVRPLG